MAREGLYCSPKWSYNMDPFRFSFSTLRIFRWCLKSSYIAPLMGGPVVPLGAAAEKLFRQGVE